MCEELVTNNNKKQVHSQFQLGCVINNAKGMQIPHQDDSEYSCHISGNFEVLWLMLYAIIDEEFYCEKLRVPFGFMLILSDDVIHGGCMGSYGSLRFHFAIKDLSKRGSERLLNKNEDTKKHFYQVFPEIAPNKKNLVIDTIFEKTDKVIKKLVPQDDADMHFKALDKELKERNIVHLVELLK